MAKVGINTGTSANAGDGSTLRAGANIINNNFDELYTALGDGTTLAPGIVTSIVAGSNISVTGTGQVTISSGLWEKTDAGINTVSNVGIGTTNPRFTLEVGAVGASGTSLYVNGDARVTGILTVGSSSVTLNGSTNEITVGTGITISGNTGIISATQVNIAGETLTGAGVTSLVAGSNITLSGSTGQVTISSAGGTWANYDSNTGISTTKKVKIENDLEVTGVSTFSGIGTSGALDVDGHTELDDVNVSGVSTFAGAADFNGAIDVDGHTELDDVNVSGVSTFAGAADFNGAIDVDGHTELDDVNVSGVSTFAGAADFNGAIDVDGHTELDDVNVSGVSTFAGAADFKDDVNVSGVSTFAGAAEFNGARVYVKSIIDVDGHTELDDVNVSGASTFSGAADFNGALDVDGHTELDDVNVSGASTFTGAADFNGAIDVDGHTELDDLNVSGVATVSTLKVGTAATINSSGLDVVGIASVGVAITMYASSGIVSATTYYGDGSQLSGVVSGITVEDEGSALSTSATTLDFVGSGVVASGTGATKTITIAGGGSGITVEDEGSALSTLATTLDFVGSGVVASGTGATKTITISGGGGALASRTTKNATTASLAAAASGDLSITAFKSYNLLKIAIDHPAWVRLYVDAASRTSDASRAEGTDPTPGSGVIAEVLTTTAGASTFLMSPAVFGWNNDGTPATTVYAKVTNKEASTSRAITVTLTLIEAEA